MSLFKWSFTYVISRIICSCMVDWQSVLQRWVPAWCACPALKKKWIKMTIMVFICFCSLHHNLSHKRWRNVEMSNFRGIYNCHKPVTTKVYMILYHDICDLTLKDAGGTQSAHRPEKLIFFKIMIRKVYNFISNLNYWCSENLFEVLHASLDQNLTNSKFFLFAIDQFSDLLRPN